MPRREVIPAWASKSQHVSKLFHSSVFTMTARRSQTPWLFLLANTFFYHLLIAGTFPLPRGTEIQRRAVGQMLSCFLTQLRRGSRAALPGTHSFKHCTARAVAGDRKFLFRPTRQLKAFPAQNASAHSRFTELATNLAANSARLKVD